ncbi:MAG: VWA domain-containing protein [Bryobacteraceae bacterium]|jgi:VWFA-related protein
MFALRVITAAFLACSLVHAQTSEPVFRNTTTLQSIPVRVLDKNGSDVSGLAAQDFTLLDNGKPQQIAFFATGRVPVSLAVLLDTSRSMDFGGKLQRAQQLLAPLLHANHPDDEIFFLPFTDRIEAFEKIAGERRILPPARGVGSLPGGGTAFYDALASALCHLRTAKNVLQAIVIITDGADQHSHLNLDQLVGLTQSSSAQIFAVGLFEDYEYSIFREGEKTVTLLGEHDIDNPVVVFDRLAKESGAEAFFPHTDDDLKKSLARIQAILQAQYTLAYYPHDSGRFRRIEVKVRRSGVRVLARRGVGSDEAGGVVHFVGASCEVSARDHPYPWETRTTRSPSGALVYREDFSNPASGWPIRRETRGQERQARSYRQGVSGMLTEGPALSVVTEYRPGLSYINGGYEIARTHPPQASATASGTVVAYGPSWDDFRASITVETDWAQPSEEWFGTQPGMIFGLSEAGYCALLLRGAGEKGKGEIAYALVKKSLPGGQVSKVIPWTNIPAARARMHKLSVERHKGQLTVRVDDQPVPVPDVEERTLDHGLVGFGLFGEGRAVFRDLAVESLP